MRVVAAVSGNMQAILDSAADDISDALRAGIETASASLLDELRGQVRAAGLGTGLEKAWRREVYPRSRRRTFHPAALVFSKAPFLHDVFDTGPTITARRGFLVVPTRQGEAMGLGKASSSRKGGAVPGGRTRRYADLEPFAERLGARIVSATEAQRGRRPSRASNPGARIVLMPSRKSPGRLVALLYARAGAKPVPVAVLVPQVKLRKRLDIAGAEARAEAALTAALGSA